jgi:chromosome segregation ATPase
MTQIEVKEPGRKEANMNTVTNAPLTIQGFSGSGAAGSPAVSGKEDELNSLDLQIEAAGKNLACKKADLDRWESSESQVRTETDALLKDLNRMAKIDGICRKTTKITPWVGMPSFIAAMGTLTLCPLAGLAGLLLTGASVVATEYSRRTIRKIDREFAPKKEEYLRSNSHLQSLVNRSTELRGDVALLEKQYGGLVEKRDTVTKELRSMIDHLSGRPDAEQAVQDDDGYLMIDGVKLNKRGFSLIQQ